MQLFFDICDMLLYLMLMTLMNDTLMGKRKEHVSRGFFLGSVLTVGGLAMLVSTLTIAYTSPVVIYGRTAFNLFLHFLLTFFYTAAVLHRLFVVLSYSIIIMVSEELTFFSLTRIAGVSVDNLVETGYIGVTMSAKLLMFFFIFLLRAVWKRKERPVSKTYTALLLVVPALSICIAYAPPFLRLDETNPDAYLLLVSFLIVINLTNYILLDNVLKLFNLRQEANILKNQVTFQSQRYSQLSEAYRNIRSFMHDTKSHLFYIQSCVENEQYDRIIPYTQESMRDLESRYCTVNTGNLAIDSFISNFMLQTQKFGIQLITDIRIERDKVPLDDYEMTIVLGNLLDNALNACRTQQTQTDIKILMKSDAYHFSIQINNSYHNHSDDKPDVTDEQFDFIHGYGLQNVKKIVNARKGLWSVNEKNGRYIVSVVIPIGLDD